MYLDDLLNIVSREPVCPKNIKHNFKKDMIPIVRSFSAVSKLLFDRENLHKIGSLHPPQEA